MSVQQSSEQGTSIMQELFIPRSNDRIVYEEFGERELRLELIVHGINMQVTT